MCVNHVSQSLGLVLFQPSRSIRFSEAVEVPGWEVAYRGVAPGHFLGLETEAEEFTSERWALHCIFLIMSSVVN